MQNLVCFREKIKEVRGKQETSTFCGEAIRKINVKNMWL